VAHQVDSKPPMYRERSTTLLGAACALAGAIVIAATFYDRFWYAPDEGAYAHVAARILAGEVLNGSVQDVHAGYVNFVNAAALALFGLDFVSLRIPLALLTALQAMAIFFVLRSRGTLPAFAGSIAASSLSFVQFVNPTAHWYCLFLTTLMPLILIKLPAGSSRRVLAVGLVVGLIAMFRQLTGAIVAIAAFAWLIFECPKTDRRNWPLTSLLYGMAALLTLYLLKQADLAAIVLFGMWPVALVCIAARRTYVAPREAFRIVGMFALGMMLACLPLLAYHLYHGTVATWLSDTVLAALQIPQLPLIHEQSHVTLAALALPYLGSWRDPVSVINAAFWLILIAMPIVNGVLLMRRVLGMTSEAGALALPWLASFYTLVSLHYQIPIYLMYVAALNAAAAVVLMPQSKRRSYATAAVLLALSCIALYFHAGQSLARGIEGIIIGARSDKLVPCGMPRCHLQLDPRDALAYRAVVEKIAAHSRDGDCILALPSDAQLYFITGRCNPTRFFNSAVALRTQADADALLSQLRSQPPAMLVHRPDDKYSTMFSDQLIASLAPLYQDTERSGEFVLYWNPARPAHARLDH
jgi:hypothetical protein